MKNLHKLTIILGIFLLTGCGGDDTGGGGSGGQPRYNTNFISFPSDYKYNRLYNGQVPVLVQDTNYTIFNSGGDEINYGEPNTQDAIKYINETLTFNESFTVLNCRKLTDNELKIFQPVPSFFYGDIFSITLEQRKNFGFSVCFLEVQDGVPSNFVGIEAKDFYVRSGDSLINATSSRDILSVSLDTVASNSNNFTTTVNQTILNFLPSTKLGKENNTYYIDNSNSGDSDLSAETILFFQGIKNSNDGSLEGKPGNLSKVFCADGNEIALGNTKDESSITLQVVCNDPVFSQFGDKCETGDNSFYCAPFSG